MAKQGSKLLFLILQEDRLMFIESLAISRGSPPGVGLPLYRKWAVAVVWSQLVAGGAGMNT